MKGKGVFSERMKKILLKAYNRKKFTEKFLTKILNEDCNALDRRLHKVGYRLSIKITEG